MYERFPQMSSAQSNEGCRHYSFRCRSLRPPVVSNDPDLLLGVTTESKLRRSKQPIHDQQIAMGSVIDDFGLAIRTDDEQRRHLALNDARGEFDIDLAPIVVGIDRPPRGIIALEGVAIASLRRVGKNWGWRNGLGTRRPIL